MVAGWAIAEGWPARVKGQPLDAAEFTAIAHLPDHRSHCLMAEDGTPLAFGQVWTDVRGTVHLVRLIVDPVRRGQGLGSALCRQLLADALALSRDGRVWLKVRRDNAAALHVYQSLGFRIEEPAPNPQLHVLVHEAPASSSRPDRGDAPSAR